MKIKELNPGDKADYSLNGNVLTLQVVDQSIDVDLEAMQEDEENNIDICLNKKGNLIQGVDTWYVANISIPPASYSMVDAGETDEEGNIVYDKVKDPFNVDEVELDLWSLPNFVKVKENQEEGVVN